tara:strand:+ start:296 stop:439 length:144 start_codon:yes stop_codon:yes gene_type:complete
MTNVDEMLARDDQSQRPVTSPESTIGENDKGPAGYSQANNHRLEEDK